MEIVPQLFYPLLSVAIVIVAGAVSTFFVSRYKKSALKITVAACGTALLGALVTAFVYMTKYYDEIIVTSGILPSVDMVGLIASLAVLLVLLFTVYFASGKKQVNDTRAIVYGAMCVAMSFALSYIRVYKLPQGGTVTFASLLPLMIYSVMFGTRRGIMACIIYGTLQSIQDPFIIHPVQFLLDYTVAYGFIGMSGIFVGKGFSKGKKSVIGFMLGGIVAVLLRYACHVLSGAFAFSDWAEEGYTLWTWTFSYNAFALIDMVICLAVGSLLFASPTFMRLIERSSAAAVVSPNPSQKEEIFESESADANLDKEEETHTDSLAQNNYNNEGLIE